MGVGGRKLGLSSGRKLTVVMRLVLKTYDKIQLTITENHDFLNKAPSLF